MPSEWIMCAAKGCSKWIYSNQPHQKYCSRRCKSVGQYRSSARPVDRVCANPGCGISFQTKRSDRQFCSYACAKQAGRPAYDRWARLQYMYKIIPERYMEILDSQGGVCAICGTDQPGGRWDTWHVDHDHSCCSGKRSCGLCVRGLLCTACNTGVGKFQDDQATLINAIRYLRQHRGQGPITIYGPPIFGYRFPEGTWDELREELRSVLGS